MKKLGLKIGLLIGFFVSFHTFSALITAVETGNWSSNSTWDLGRKPECGDQIIIPEGYTVTVNTMVNFTIGGVDCSTTSIEVSGNLTFQSGKKITMDAGCCIHISVSGRLNPSGVGGGSSEDIVINGVKVWQASDGSVLGSISSFGVYLGCSPTLLPIELIDFSLESYLEDQMAILWTTISEKDNDYFLVERSRNASFWEEVGTVKGSLNSQSKIEYKIVDEYPFLGTSYYRLTQYDVNGNSQVLGVLDFESLSSKYILYPIPTNTLMFLEGSDLKNSSVKVFDNLGKEIKVNQNFIGDKISFDFSNIQNGFYLVSIVNGKTKKTQRVSVIHK